MARIAKARNARLSIPRVGRAQEPYKAALKSRVIAAAPRTAATTPAQPSNAPAAPSAPSAPSTTAAPSAPAAPKGLFDLPTYAPQAGQADPRDATYWANLSKLKFAAEQDYSKGLFEQQGADTSYNDALQTAIRNRGLQQRGLGEDAIRGNLGASGWLNRNEALQTTQYTQERATASLTKSQEDQARAAARSAILQGYSVDAAAELGEAAARYAQRAAEAAANAEPSAGPEPVAAAPAAPSGPAAGPFWGNKGPGGYLYLRPKKKR